MARRERPNSATLAPAKPRSPGQPAASPDFVHRGFTDPALLILIVVTVLSLWGTWHSSRRSAGIDFYQYWAAGRATRELHGTDLYTDEARTQIATEFVRRAQEDANATRLRAAAEYRQPLETYQSPFLYTLVGLFSTGDYEIDYERYRLLQLTLMVMGCLGFCRNLRYSAVQSRIAT